MSYHSKLYSISFQLRGKSAPTILDDIKLTINNTSITIRSNYTLNKNSESDSENVMGGFFHLIIIRQNLLWCNIGGGIIHLVILVVLNLVLLLVMVKVIWVLGPPTSPPRKLIVGLMMVIVFISK